MAKTFVQRIGLLAMLGVIIIITSITDMESMLGVFLFSIPFIGAAMMYLALKGNVMQNKELALVGLASIILGVTYWLGDTIFGGFSMKNIGLTIAIGTELFILIEVIMLWETK